MQECCSHVLVAEQEDEGVHVSRKTTQFPLCFDLMAKLLQEELVSLLHARAYSGR